MNEYEFGIKIKAVLDSGLELGPVQLSRLRAARERALSDDRQRVGIAELATSGASGVRFGAGSVLVRVVLPALILLAAVIGWQNWQTESAPAAPAEDQMGQLDADLLKSDIPIDALLDRDFRAYMQKVMNRERE
jgi:cytochrome c-type biogenesis protein CcmH/NrfG